MPFKPGESGNPKGRPKGIVDRRARYLEIIEQYGDKLVEKAIEKAFWGNEQMLKLLLDRILPAKPRDRIDNVEEQ